MQALMHLAMGRGTPHQYHNQILSCYSRSLGNMLDCRVRLAGSVTTR